MTSQSSRQVALRVAAWLALVIPAVTVAWSRAEPNLEIILPALLLLALPLWLPTRWGFIKLAITIPLTSLLIVAGSQLPSTIVILGFVLAEIAVQKKTRDILLASVISIVLVGATSLVVGETDNLRPLWLVHGVGILMFVAVGVAIRERRALVEETKNSLEFAEAAHNIQLAEAIAQERLSISKDLHNRLGHQLSVISLTTEVAKQSDSVSEETHKNLDVIGQSARHSLEEISNYLESLREKPGSDGHTEKLADKFSRFRALGLDIETEVTGLPETEDRELLTFLDSAIEELLMNARKYGDGKVIYEQSSQTGGVLISVTNNLSLSPEKPSGGGYGLKDIAEGASAIGVDFSFGLTSENQFRAELTIQERS